MEPESIPSQPDFAVVVPVLDEAEALPALLTELRRHGLFERTIFFDNGSTDGSLALLRAAGAVCMRESRRGYGFPCLAGARAAAVAGARAVVFLEADGTDDPAEVRQLVQPVLVGAADLVLGSRRRAVRGASAGRMPLHQRLGNDWLALTLRLFFGMRLSDDAPFRAVRIDLLQSLRLEERAYAFPTEMAVKAHLAGARIAVCDVSYRPRAGTSKIAGTWRGSTLAVRDIGWCLLRLRLSGFLPQR
ncbi:MAG: glycosyltransferase family 2 protein [Thermoleophilia bacterium]